VNPSSLKCGVANAAKTFKRIMQLVQKTGRASLLYTTRNA